MLLSDTLHATCASGLQGVLRDELISLGLSGVDSRGAGAAFGGGLAAGYRACLHSRVANRILLPLHVGPAPDADSLYALIRQIDWSAHLAVDGSLAVDFFSANSGITHTQYGALKVKDAIVDQFRDAVGQRPDVDRDTPDVRINVYVFRDKARIALDLSGSSLHRRGYRGDGGPAPLKENVAAALLLASGWPAVVEAGGGAGFIDPMCGSGTLVVEAATIAARRAPGLGRGHWGFLGWKGHDPALWNGLLDEARAAVRPVEVPVRGYDRDPRAVAAARASVLACGVEGDVSVEAGDLREHVDAASGTPGLLLSNPPWGERLTTSRDDYADMGQALSRGYPGWRCALFTSVTAPLSALSLPLAPVLDVRNGGIDCRLSMGDVPGLGRGGRSTPDIDVTPVVNRLAKNLKSLKGFVRQRNVRALRVYDADLPDFALAVDVFDCGIAGDERHVVVQEYEAPRSVNQALAADRREGFLDALPAALDTVPERLHLKTRTRQRGDRQYLRRDAEQGHAVGGAVTAVLHEGGACYRLNFSDYLDVGLFIDHRPVRRFIGERSAAGGRFLNLFAYTAAPTVQAALGGADASVSVDLSNRYVSWARDNLALNRCDAQAHTVVRSDVMTWLSSADEAAFDTILLDPPTHSNSTSTERDWDVQADHVDAILACMARLAPGGLLIFSNNYRRFKLDPSVVHRYDVQDRSAWSIDPDFRRRANIHRCWFIREAES